MGLRWFAVTLRLAGQGLGGAVPAYLALAFVCLVLAVIGRRHPAAAQPHHLPGVPGGGRAAAGRQPRPGPSLAGSVAACSRRPRSAGCSRCWLRTAWGWRCQAGPDLGPGARLAVVGTVAVVAAFLLGGLAGLGGMLALGLSRTARLPFGPWLVGALLGVLGGGEVAGWFQASSAPGRPGQPLRTMMRPS